MLNRKLIAASTAGWLRLEVLASNVPGLRGVLPDPFDLFSYARNLKGGGLIAVLALLLREHVELLSTGTKYLTRAELRSWFRRWVPGVVVATTLLNAMTGHLEESPEHTGARHDADAGPIAAQWVDWPTAVTGTRGHRTWLRRLMWFGAPVVAAALGSLSPVIGVVVATAGVIWVVRSVRAERRWRDEHRFTRSDPAERVVLEEVADLEAMMSRIGPLGPRTRRALGTLATRLGRHVYRDGGTESAEDAAAWFVRGGGEPTQIRFTSKTASFTERLDRALRRLRIQLSDDEARLLAYRYVARHELGHAFQEAVRRTVRRDLGGRTLKAGLAGRLQRTEKMSSVRLENERFAEGVALASITHYLVEHYPQLAGLEQRVLRALTQEITAGRPAGYNLPHPPFELTRILGLAQTLEAAQTARRRQAARVATIAALAAGFVVGTATPAEAGHGALSHLASHTVSWAAGLGIFEAGVLAGVLGAGAIAVAAILTTRWASRALRGARTTRAPTEPAAQPRSGPASPPEPGGSAVRRPLAWTKVRARLAAGVLLVALSGSLVSSGAPVPVELTNGQRRQVAEFTAAGFVLVNSPAAQRLMLPDQRRAALLVGSVTERGLTLGDGLGNFAYGASAQRTPHWTGPGDWEQRWVGPAELAAAWRARTTEPQARSGALSYYLSQTPSGPVALLTEQVGTRQRLLRATHLDSSRAALTPPYRGTPAPTTSDMIDRASAAVVRITYPPGAGTGEPNIGSGALISPDGLILTADHVAARARNGTLIAHLRDGRRFPVRMVSTLPIQRLRQLLEPIAGPQARSLDYRPADGALTRTVDIALLQIVPTANAPRLPYLPLAASNPRVGEPVVGLGYPFTPDSGETPRLTITGGPVLPFAPDEHQRGIPTRQRRSPTQLWFLGPNSNGFSGGPIVNGRGEVIAPISHAHPLPAGGSLGGPDATRLITNHAGLPTAD